MAEKKADLLARALELGLNVTEKNTVVQIKEALSTAKEGTEPVVEKKVTKATKAGKRSAKAQREDAEAEAKEARKERIAKGEEEEAKVEKRGPVPVTRPKIERRSKAYRKAAEAIDNTKSYDLKEAVKLAKDSSTVKFDATIELHVKLGVDPRQADQNVRESLVLPHGSGNIVKVAVFAPADQHEAAKAAGADIVGEAEFLQQLDKEQLDFDVLVSMPQMMAQLGKYARLLGPKGLMPNPKSGTVTKDVPAAVKEAKAGRIEFRVDPQGIIHVAVGKVSFDANKLAENAQTIMDAISAARPQNIKGIYLQSAYVTSTMGPSIRLSV